MPNSIELEFVPCQEDYNRATKIVLYNTLLSSKDILLVTIAWAVSVLFWILFSRSFILIYLVAFFSLMLLFIALYYLVIPIWIFRHRVKDLGSVTVTIGDDGFQSITKHIQSKVSWGYFTKVLETNHFFILFGKGRQFSLLPKRAFTNEGQLYVFRDCLKVHNVSLIEKS